MTHSVDIQQIIYALERAEHRLMKQADRLHKARDYGAEFFTEDAERMREAIVLLSKPKCTQSCALEVGKQGSYNPLCPNHAGKTCKEIRA